MSRGRENIQELTWSALHDEHDIITKQLQYQNNVAEKKELAERLKKIESVTLSRKDGFVKLNTTLVTHIEECGNLPPIKSSYESVNSWGNYFLSFVGIRTTQGFANQAQKVTAQALEKHKEESLRGYLSEGEKYSIQAIANLKQTYEDLKKAGITKGTVMTALQAVFAEYHFPLDEKGYEEKMKAVKTHLGLHH